MINKRQILILIVFSTSMINVLLSQELDKINKDWGKIESIFQNFEPNSKLIKYCEFEYKKESQVDVDMFDIDYKLLLSNIDKSKVVKLVDYYVKFCNECDSGSMIEKFRKEKDSFLVGDFYSIDLHYKVVERKTYAIMAMIYSNEGYILFSMGFRKEKNSQPPTQGIHHAGSQSK